MIRSSEQRKQMFNLSAVEETEFTPVKLDEFQRQSIPGEITVLNSVNNSIDTTPPAKISDLRIESITKCNESENQTLTYTFVWTAVGDNMDIGTGKKGPCTLFIC